MAPNYYTKLVFALNTNCNQSNHTMQHVQLNEFVLPMVMNSNKTINHFSVITNRHWYRCDMTIILKQKDCIQQAFNILARAISGSMTNVIK